MSKYNYIEIGDRIRSERKKLGLSQENLIDTIKDKGKPTCGRNILSGLENGDESAFNGISLDKMLALCEEFNCSLSYLLGEYSCHNYNNEFIHNQLGLTESAINLLINTTAEGKNRYLFVLSELITQESILDLITKYFFLAKGKNATVEQQTVSDSFYFDTINGTITAGKNLALGTSELYLFSEEYIELTSNLIKSSLLSAIQEEIVLFENRYKLEHHNHQWTITYKEE